MLPDTEWFRTTSSRKYHERPFYEVGMISHSFFGVTTIMYWIHIVSFEPWELLVPSGHF